jgi:hypothetical protein
VRPRGIICFHELDLTTRIRSCPNGTLFDRMCDLRRKPSAAPVSG